MSVATRRTSLLTVAGLALVLAAAGPSVAGVRVASVVPFGAAVLALAAGHLALARLAGRARDGVAALVRVGSLLLVFPMANLANRGRAVAWYSIAVLASGLCLVAVARLAAPLEALSERAAHRPRVRLVVALWVLGVGLVTGWLAVATLSTPIASDTITYWATFTELSEHRPGGAILRTPLYTLLFATLHGLGGSGWQLIALQLALRAVSCALAAWVLAQTSPLGAALVGTLLALDPVSAASGVGYLTESLYTTGLLASLVIAVSHLQRGRSVPVWELVAAGLCYGWAFFFRPNGVGLIAPLALAYLIATRSLWRALLPLGGVAAVTVGIVLLNWVRTDALTLGAAGVYLAFPLFSQHLFHPANGPASTAIDARLRTCFPDLDYTRVNANTSNEYIHTKFSPCLIERVPGGPAAVFRLYGDAYGEAIRARPLLFLRQMLLESARFLSVTVVYYAPATTGFVDYTDVAGFCRHEPPFADYPPALTAFVCPMPSSNAAWRAEVLRLAFATRMLFQPYLYVYDPHVYRAGYYEVPVPVLAGAAAVLWFALVVIVARPPYRLWAAGAALLTLYGAAATAFGQVTILRYVAVTSPFLLVLSAVFAITFAEDVAALVRVVGRRGGTLPRLAIVREWAPCVGDGSAVPEAAPCPTTRVPVGGALGLLPGGPPPVSQPAQETGAEAPPLLSPPASIDERALDLVRRALTEHQFRGDTAYLETDEGRADMQNHLTTRLELDRASVVPWLARVRPLRGARILEIGCGTGSSTVALAEQGAEVVAVDVAGQRIDVARTRCGAYGVDGVEFRVADAADLPADLVQREFDFIIFFASLEHMLLEDRLRAMQRTWAMLPAGGLWCVTDTPNRLWYFDTHTALMPFFHWLPDELARTYARFSDRPSIRRWGHDHSRPTVEFLQLGRGVSFHEFELGLAPLRSLRVVSCRDEFLIRRALDAPAYEACSIEEKFVRLMGEVAPGVHPGFFLPSLDLVIEKRA